MSSAANKNVIFFVIPFGKEDVDSVYRQVYEPVTKELGYEAIRIDQIDDGRPKVNQIIDQLSHAYFIVGDLTYERPNCYYEIGYAHAIRSEEHHRIIICAKDDHVPDKVHFDLRVYDVLGWSLAAIDTFRTRFKERLVQRSKMLNPQIEVKQTPSKQIPDLDQLARNFRKSNTIITNESYMEFVAKVSEINFKDMPLADMTEAMARSAIHTFGSPIGAVVRINDLCPRPIDDGIEATLPHYPQNEYWLFNRSSEFYFWGELFENGRRKDCVFLDTRINRVTEALLRLGRLYKELAVPEDKEAHLLIRHGNIKGKFLSVASPNRFMSAVNACSKDNVSSNLSIKVKELMSLEVLQQQVFTVVHKLGEMFSMYDVKKSDTDPIVSAFFEGRIL